MRDMRVLLDGAGFVWNFMYFSCIFTTEIQHLFCFLMSLKPASGVGRHACVSESVWTTSVPFFFPFRSLPLASSLLLAHFGEGPGHRIALADRSRHWGCTHRSRTFRVTYSVPSFSPVLLLYCTANPSARSFRAYQYLKRSQVPPAFYCQL